MCGLTLGLFAASFLIVSLLVPRVVRRLSGPGTMLLGTGMQILGLALTFTVEQAA